MTHRKLQVSAGFAPALDTPEHILLAEQLGFARAWCYDAPAVWADLWMTLSRAADRTQRIGLGTAVIVPSYRHVMTTAAAIATLAAQAPDRVVVGIGVGHGNQMIGGRAMSWANTARYISALRALLRGEEVEWEGGLAKLLQGDGFAARRPANVPILAAAQGPKGLEIARTLCDGVIATLTPNAGFDWSSVLIMGTVLPEDGSMNAERVMDAAGHGAAVAYHVTYGADWRTNPAFAQVPNSKVWAEAVEKIAPERRHLAVWSKHLVGLTDEDKLVVTPELVRQMTFTGTPDELRSRLRDLQAKGATEVIFQPGGRDIRGELTRFAAMAGLEAR